MLLGTAAMLFPREGLPGVDGVEPGSVKPRLLRLIPAAFDERVPLELT
jgi:hypothetical protein